MNMSTKSRYALNALIDFMLCEAVGPVALATISTRQQVSLSYLEQLFSSLRRAGIVQSTRGPGGGYALARPSTQITLADIVIAVDDPLGRADLEDAERDPSQALWSRLSGAMLQHMSTITLETVVSEQKAKGVTVVALPVGATTVRRPAGKKAGTTAPNAVFAFGRSTAR
jgi:Rrf2 family transcriptional regulator, iron-sulfur cluster assembly transcription factor